MKDTPIGTSSDRDTITFRTSQHQPSERRVANRTGLHWQTIWLFKLSHASKPDPDAKKGVFKRIPFRNLSGRTRDFSRIYPVV